MVIQSHIYLQLDTVQQVVILTNFLNCTFDNKKLTKVFSKFYLTLPVFADTQFLMYQLDKNIDKWTITHQICQ